MEASIIVGIGMTKDQVLSFEVLKHSILRYQRSDLKLTVIPLDEIGNDKIQKQGVFQKTPFSLQRFYLASELLILSHHNYGIYLDSDMLVLDDLVEILDGFELNNKSIQTVQVKPEWNRRPQSSVMVFNRAGAQALSDSFDQYLDNHISYDELIYLKTVKYGRDIPWFWNCLEYMSGESKLIHWTDVDTQPWLQKGNPNSSVWYSALFQYLQETDAHKLLEREVAYGNVLPSLIYVQRSGPSITKFPVSFLFKDLFFIPPPRLKRLKGRVFRKLVGPAFFVLRGAQSLLRNGQINVR